MSIRFSILTLAALLLINCSKDGTTPDTPPTAPEEKWDENLVVGGIVQASSFQQGQNPEYLVDGQTFESPNYFGSLNTSEHAGVQHEEWVIVSLNTAQRINEVRLYPKAADLNDGFPVDFRIEISDESDYLLDTGGGIKKATSLLCGNEPFLIHNVDILSNVDLKKLYDTHVQTNPLATLLVSQRNTSRYLLFNKENRLCGWRNHETGEVKSYYPYFDPDQHNEYAFSGIHVLSPKILELMEEWTGKFSIINFYLAICAKTDIRAYMADNLKLLDIGKPETLAAAEEWLRQNI